MEQVGAPGFNLIFFWDLKIFSPPNEGTEDSRHVEKKRYISLVSFQNPWAESGITKVCPRSIWKDDQGRHLNTSWPLILWQRIKQVVLCLSEVIGIFIELNKNRRSSLCTFSHYWGTHSPELGLINLAWNLVINSTLSLVTSWESCTPYLIGLKPRPFHKDNKWLYSMYKVLLRIYRY